MGTFPQQICSPSFLFALVELKTSLSNLLLRYDILGGRTILRGLQVCGLFLSDRSSIQQPLLQLSLLFPDEFGLFEDGVPSLDVGVGFSQPNNSHLPPPLKVLVQKYAGRQSHFDVADFYWHVRRQFRAINLNSGQVFIIVAPDLRKKQQ